MTPDVLVTSPVSVITRRYFAASARSFAANSPGLIGALTRIIEAAAPHLASSVKWGQGCWLDEGSPRIYIHAGKDHVQLGFFRGTSLKDPKHLLVGGGQYLRHVKVRTAGDIDAAAFKALVRQVYSDDMAARREGRKKACSRP